MESVEVRLWKTFEAVLRFIFISIFRIKIIERNWDNFIQFVKFGLVGISNTLISYVSYLIFFYLGCYYLVASVLSFIVSVTNSFYWNNKYVFKENADEKRSLIKAYVKTFIAYASTGLVLANVLLILWVDAMHVSEVIAPLINLVVTIPLNFVINKYWAFKA